jgi:hypothetical protein
MHDLVDLYHLQGAPTKEIIDSQHSEIKRKQKTYEAQSLKAWVWLRLSRALMI